MKTNFKVIIFLINRVSSTTYQKFFYHCVFPLNYIHLLTENKSHSSFLILLQYRFVLLAEVHTIREAKEKKNFREKLGDALSGHEDQVADKDSFKTGYLEGYMTGKEEPQEGRQISAAGRPSLSLGCSPTSMSRWSLCFGEQTQQSLHFYFSLDRATLVCTC